MQMSTRQPAHGREATDHECEARRISGDLFASSAPGRPDRRRQCRILARDLVEARLLDSDIRSSHVEVFGLPRRGFDQNGGAPRNRLALSVLARDTSLRVSRNGLWPSAGRVPLVERFARPPGRRICCLGSHQSGNETCTILDLALAEDNADVVLDRSLGKAETQAYLGVALTLDNQIENLVFTICEFFSR